MTQQEHDTVPLLRVSNLKKSFGSYQALRGISFDMSKGEIISVLGPSGCGKSTLLSLVAGLAQPDEGSILLNGQMIASQKMLLPPEKRGITMVFQDYALWPHMSVSDNIAYGLKRMKLEQGESKTRIRELISLLRWKAWRNGCLPSCPEGSSSGSPSPGRLRPAPVNAAGRASLQSGYEAARGDALGDGVSIPSPGNQRVPRHA